MQEAAQLAAQAVRSRPAGTRWLVACDVDADGLVAGAVAALALRRIGHRFVLRPGRDKTAGGYRALFAEASDAVLLLDKGSSHLPLLAQLAAASGRMVAVVDHHNVPGPVPAGVTVLNPRLAGLDGSRDASASTTAAALALALCGDEALAWAPTALAGAVGDLQDEGGWRGWNLELARRARQAGHLQARPLPKLAGPSLAAAVAHLDPPMPGLHGDLDASRAFVSRLGLDADTDPDDLDAEGQAALVSALLLRLLAHGATPEDPRVLMAEADWHVPLGLPLRQVYRMADACGREGKPGAGLAFLMGDKAARTEAAACLARHASALREAMAQLGREGPQVRAAVQVAWTGNPAYSGLVAGAGLERLPDSTRPLAILALRPDGQVQVSTRGHHAHVAAGMDLGRACHEAAAAVGAEGGGHPVAAGAVIAADRADAFLDALDAALVRQGFMGPTGSQRP